MAEFVGTVATAALIVFAVSLLTTFMEISQAASDVDLADRRSIAQALSRRSSRRSLRWHDHRQRRQQRQRAWSLGRKAVVCLVTFTASYGVGAAQNIAPPPAVSVTPVVSRQVTETSDYIGRVTPIDKVDIVARVPGFIEQRTFTEGEQVKKGDLLFRVEQATYKAAVEQARASLAKAKATEVNANLQVRVAYSEPRVRCPTRASASAFASLSAAAAVPPVMVRDFCDIALASSPYAA